MIKIGKILIEVIAWLSIAICPTIIAAFISLAIYLKWENKLIAITVLIAGFIVGAIWATKISIKHGAAEWISQIRKCHKYALFRVSTNLGKEQPPQKLQAVILCEVE